MSFPKPELRLLIAAPRGFCAGVDRAIKIVELAIERFGPPVYVRHEIVHNRFVVDRLRGLGAVFGEAFETLAASSGHDDCKRAAGEAADVTTGSCACGAFCHGSLVRLTV